MRQSQLVVAICGALALTVSVSATANMTDGLPAAGNSRVIVAMKPGAAAAGHAAIRAAGGNIKQVIFGTDAVAIEVPTQALFGLSHNPNIEYIEEDAIRVPLATSTPSDGGTYALGQQVPYGIKLVQADLLSDSLAGNRKLCIIDSGYDGGHEDLSHTGNVTGENDSGSGSWSVDENHHGSHVAGTISALNNANTGVVGVNSNRQLKLHIIKVFNAAGWAYSSSLTTAANHCKAAGANVISMSLGGGAKSRTEERAFDSIAASGMLSIAAAGNDGNTVLSYPASYASIMSVAAIDANKAWATFSQYNAAVDISGPGVDVLSTVPAHTVPVPQLTVGTTTYTPGSMDGSPTTSASYPLADFGLGGAAVTGSMTNKICLIQRGTYEFGVKVKNCQLSGGKGAVVYNNAPGAFGGTLGTTTGVSIPSVTATDTDGAAMKLQLGQTAVISFGVSALVKYESYDGTSMATPHVAAVAALVWSYHTNCSGNQIKASLEKSAFDLDVAGRDNKTGFGLVQALAAHNRINSLGCGN